MSSTRILAVSAVILSALPAFAQSEPQINENLIRYLALTPAQVREIATNDHEYNQRNSARQDRYLKVIRDLQDIEDPPSLGARYAEIELMRREVVADLGAVRGRNRALMTAEQRERLSRIENTRPLGTVVAQAVCSGLIRPTASSSLIGATYYCIYSTTPPALRLFLSLTEAQVTAIDSAGSEINRLQGEAYGRSLRVSPLILFETARDPLDPARLGALYAELRRIEAELANVRFSFVDRLRSMLSPVQEARLRELQDAEPLRRLLPVAECEGLVPIVSPQNDPVPGGYLNFEGLHCAAREAR